MKKELGNNLIVMPKMLIYQWMEEVTNKMKGISYFNYNGANKKQSIDLSHYDIVLVSYETV